MGTDRNTRQHEVRARDGRALVVTEGGDPGGDLVLVHHGTPTSSVLAGWWVDDAAPWHPAGLLRSTGVRRIGPPAGS
jgi:hypothetical protein